MSAAPFAPPPGRDRLKRLRALKHARGRAKAGRFLVEGRRAIETALDAGIALEVFADPSALTARDRALVDRLADAGAPVAPLGPDDLAAVADTVTPQAFVATAPMPVADLDAVLAAAGRVVLVVDAVRDPGNLGSILRAADAYAVATVVVLAGTVDVYNPKVVRGAMGAHFHVAIASSIEPEAAHTALDSAGFAPWLAVAHGGETPDAIDRTDRVALVIGGEADGALATTGARAARRVTLPTPGRAESLNVAVATGILLDRLCGRG